MNFDDMKTKGNWFFLSIFLILGIVLVVYGFSHLTIDMPYDFVQITIGNLIIFVGVYGYSKELNPEVI